MVLPKCLCTIVSFYFLSLLVGNRTEGEGLLQNMESPASGFWYRGSEELTHPKPSYKKGQKLFRGASNLWKLLTLTNTHLYLGGNKGLHCSNSTLGSHDLTGSYHIGKTFHMLKLAVWWFQISFWFFPNSTSLQPPRFPKNYFFLVRNSTQMALTAPLFPLNWCHRLQNLDQFGVNGSKILIKLVSTTPKSVTKWCQRLQIFTELGVYTNWH